jgi:hypothetical protein
MPSWRETIASRLAIQLTRARTLTAESPSLKHKDHSPRFLVAPIAAFLLKSFSTLV